VRRFEVWRELLRGTGLKGIEVTTSRNMSLRISEICHYRLDEYSTPYRYQEPQRLCHWNMLSVPTNTIL